MKVTAKACMRTPSCLIPARTNSFLSARCARLATSTVERLYCFPMDKSYCLAAPHVQSCSIQRQKVFSLFGNTAGIAGQYSATAVLKTGQVVISGGYDGKNLLPQVTIWTYEP